MINFKEKYPKIFSECFSLGVPEHWESIVDELCTDLQEYADKSGRQAQCVQVKEKFGSLRFYLVSEDDEMDNMIRVATTKSREVCIKCGSTENITPSTSGWISYTCDNCKQKPMK